MNTRPRTASLRAILRQWWWHIEDLFSPWFLTLAIASALASLGYFLWVIA